MREIKFRAWHPQDKRWIPWADWGEAVDHFATGYENGTFSLHGHEDHCVYSQYTGLKDGVGREIYVGDILEDADGNMHEVQEVPGHIIVRHDDGSSDFIAERNIFAVIGNIYENPELIK
ncbi:YopX family protein [Sulfitobacter sp. 1A10445]|uniref:YopX family protein n=1 Tax=unclassified Sulfitobacter TaxID=196795 RepID=UPI00374685A5